MTTTPHIITITVKDTDNSTNKEGATVYVRNTTKKSTLESTNKTNSSGVAVVDLANLPVQAGQTEPYDTGDAILIIAYDGKNHDAVRYVVAGSSESQTLNLNPIHHAIQSAVKLVTIVGGNTTGTVAYFKVYAVDSGDLLLHVEVPANDTRDVYYGTHGLGGSGGFVVEREANTLIVTARIR